jgi:hypothetical protein
MRHITGETLPHPVQEREVSAPRVRPVNYVTCSLSRLRGRVRGRGLFAPWTSPLPDASRPTSPASGRGKRITYLRTTPKSLSFPIGASIILEQALDVVEFKLRPIRLAEAASQFLEDAARSLGVDFARHLDGGVVAIITPAQRPA